MVTGAVVAIVVPDVEPDVTAVVGPDVIADVGCVEAIGVVEASELLPIAGAK